MNDVILEQYDESKALFDSFSQRISDLLEDLLRANSIHIHSVTNRTKTKKNLKQKLDINQGKYKSLEEITDICGVRVITYFSDDVDHAAHVVESEFKIDQENSVDKRKLLDPDRFGYMSVHYIVSLTDDRANLTEYQDFLDLKVEIQIRSILQHTWAEMEHDLGYKNKFEVPRSIRRQFSRIAGLLEIADDEFVSIRDEISEYEAIITERVVSDDDPVFIDKASLSAFVKTSLTLKEVDQAIAQLAKAQLDFNPAYVDRLIKKLLYFELLTIADVEESLVSHRDLVVGMADANIESGAQETISQGIGLFYLSYTLVTESRSVDKLMKYLLVFKLGDDDENDRREFAENFLRIYDQLVSSS